jgi:hypothetical protein
VFEHSSATISGKRRSQKASRQQKKPPKEEKKEKEVIKPVTPDKPTLVGTSTALEKQYLRLTGDSDMDPSTFRPLAVLKDSFAYCMEKYAQLGSYEYIEEQLRSIRQDLMVQHITDPFCTTVYESHARLAIEHEDWPNFNQAMDQLDGLYLTSRFGSFDQLCEFSCWRILYLIGVDDLSGLYQFIPRLPANVANSEPVQFAFEAWTVAVGGEWTKFLTLMKEAEPLRARVMSIKAKAIRIDGANCIQGAARALSLEDYRQLLAFDTEEETQAFLVELDLQLPPT